MGLKTLSDLKDSSESLVEVNEKNKNNIKTTQASLNYHTTQANNAAQVYSMAQMKYNQAVSARNAAVNRPRQEGEDMESISREMSIYNRMVADAEREQQEARNRYKISLQHQKKAALDYEKAQSDYRDSFNNLSNIKSEIGAKITDYTNTYGEAAVLVEFGKGENVVPFLQKLMEKRREATSILNKVLRSLGEQEVSFDSEDIPDADAPKVKKRVKVPLGRLNRASSNESKGAYSFQKNETLNLLNSFNYSNGTINMEYNNGLAAYLMQNCGVKYVNFSDLDSRIAYDLGKAVYDAKNEFPDLDINYLGSIQNQIHGMSIAFEKSQYEHYIRKGYDENMAKQLAKYDTEHYIINNEEFNDIEGTYAWSLNTFNPSLTMYNGVAVNTQYGTNYNCFLSYKQNDEKLRHAPIGCGTPKACMDHELGHEIDKLLNASEDPVINELYEDMIQNHRPEEVLSGYSKKNINEFIAESYSEYRNNPNPRTISVEVYKRLKYLRDNPTTRKRELKLRGR